MKKTMQLLAFAGLLLATTSSLQSAVVLNWINWNAPGSYPNSSSLGIYNFNYATGTTGTILMPNNTPVSITLSGEILNPSQFDSSGFGIASNSYWVDRNHAGSTYISANVPTLPSNGDRIAVAGSGNPIQTLTFSQPVSNIVMNVWSLGRPSDLGSWRFDQPFAILSQNTGQYPSAPFALQAESMNTLNGYEGAGTIQFLGTFSTLSWEVLDPEFYAVWNIGVTSASVNPVPEPGQIAASLLLLTGIAGYVFLKRRKLAKTAAAL